MTHPLSSRVVPTWDFLWLYPKFCSLSNTVSNSAHVSPIYLGLDYCLQAKMRNNISQLPEHLSHRRVLDHFTTTRSVPASLRMVAFRFMAVVSSCSGRERALSQWAAQGAGRSCWQSWRGSSVLPAGALLSSLLEMNATIYVWRVPKNFPPELLIFYLQFMDYPCCSPPYCSQTLNKIKKPIMPPRLPIKYNATDSQGLHRAGWGCPLWTEAGQIPVCCCEKCSAYCASCTTGYRGWILF